MIRAKEAIKISKKSKKKINWYNNASKALINAMHEIEHAANNGKRDVKVIGMDDNTAKILRSYGYILEPEKISPRCVDKADGTYERVCECTKISW